MKIALIGASENKPLSKRLFSRLKDAGYSVYPVNPNCETIDGIACYDSLSSLSDEVNIVVFMVNPALSLKILEEVVALNIKKVWFQPGTFDDKVLDFCRKHNLQMEYEKCLIISPLDVLTNFLAQV